MDTQAEDIQAEGNLAEDIHAADIPGPAGSQQVDNNTREVDRLLPDPLPEPGLPAGLEGALHGPGPGQEPGLPELPEFPELPGSPNPEN